MNRTIEYTIPESQNGLRVEQFLRRKGYSRQNFTEIKRMPQSILVNGIHYYMRQTLAAGDHLQVCICETESSEKIPPVKLPLNIVYEDEDILVINKPAGMPIHPSMKNYYNSLANALAWYYQDQGKPFIFRCSNRLDRDTSAGPTASTPTLPPTSPTTTTSWPPAALPRPSTSGVQTIMAMWPA